MYRLPSVNVRKFILIFKIDSSIDAIIMNLHFPMVPEDSLTDFEKKLQMLNDCHAMINDISSKTARVVVTFDPWSKFVIDQLRIDVNKALQDINKSQNNFIEVDMHEVDINQIDWRKHAVSLRIISRLQPYTFFCLLLTIGEAKTASAISTFQCDR